MKKRMLDFYLAVAHESAKLSRARRLQVGSVIVRGDTILGYGWNGTPPGWDNDCEDVNEDGSLKTKSEVVHAEMNAILKVAKSHESCKDATLIITHSPCSECAKLILTSGVKTVFYETDYRDDLGIQMLRKGGVEVIKASDD